MTDKLKACADLLGITLLDHVIVGADDYFSFRERGMMGGNASAGRDDVAASALAASRRKGRSVTVTKSRGDPRSQRLRWRFQCLAAETLRNPGDACDQLAKVESIATVAAALGFKKEASAARGLADAFRSADNHAMKLSDLLELREWLGEENNLSARVATTVAALTSGK